MTTVTFDTLKFANRLKAAGVPDKQAEAEAEALAEILEANIKDLATKEDLKLLEAKLTGELTLVKWMLSISLAGVIALVLKAFFPL